MIALPAKKKSSSTPLRSNRDMQLNLLDSCYRKKTLS